MNFTNLISESELDVLINDVGLSDSIKSELVQHHHMERILYDPVEAVSGYFYWKETVPKKVNLIHFCDLCVVYDFIDDQETLADLIFKYRIEMFFFGGSIYFDADAAEEHFQSVIH